MSGFAFAGTDIRRFGATGPGFHPCRIEVAAFFAVSKSFLSGNTQTRQLWQFDDQVVGIY